MKRPLRLFLVAGEVSGDLLGGRLMAALRQLTGEQVVFDGIGGAQMTAQGLVSRFPMAELSLMGIAETLPHLPALLRRLHETHAAVRTTRPDALITIDAPAFSLRLARRIGPGVTRRIHYVAPQVWAWRPGRAAQVARSLDRLLTLLPFEPPYFTPLGLACDYVGHPVIESGALDGNGQRFRHQLGIEADTPLLVLLPGSRHGEIKRLLTVFRQTVQGLQHRLPDLVTVTPLAAGVAGAVRDGLAGLERVWFVEQEGVKYDAFAAAHAALAASGTVTLELALAGTPSVVSYRVAPVTAWLAKRLLQVPYVALSNIVLGAPVYPELLQELCTPESLTTALLPLLDRLNPVWQKQRAALRAVPGIMKAGQGLPSDRAAGVVLADLADAYGAT